MKTRRELIAEVEELAGDLGEEISTDRMNNAALAELAASLRARLEEQTKPAGSPAAEPTTPSTLTAPPPVLQADPPRPPRAVHDSAPKRQSVNGDAAAATQGGPPAPKIVQPAPPRAPYYVAPGRSVIAQGRVLGPLKPVKVTDFPGGQKDLDHLVMKGAVVQNA